MRIDAHQHFWNYDPLEYDWIDHSMMKLQKDFLPEELQKLIIEQGISGTVAVQARQSIDETGFLLNIADQNNFVKGVVGWVDLCCENWQDDVEKFTNNTNLKGFREITQGQPDERYFSNLQFIESVQDLGKLGLTYDLLIYHDQLPSLMAFAGRLNNQKLVLDHIGKPDIAKGETEKWRKGIKELGNMDHVFCKLSGMVTEATWNKWKYRDFVPYMEAVLEAFGPKRLMLGSDWPVCLLSASYPEVWAIVDRFIATLSASEQNDIKGNNAIEFYNLEN